MGTVHIIIDFLLSLLRDPACATLLTIGSFLATIRPTKSTQPQRKSNKKDDLSPCHTHLRMTDMERCQRNVSSTAQKEGR